MRTYEFTVIFKPNDEDVTKGKELINTGFKDHAVAVTKEESLGVRFLAYPIKKSEKGHYYYYELEAEPNEIAALDRSFKLMAPVLKFLFVKKD